MRPKPPGPISYASNLAHVVQKGAGDDEVDVHTRRAYAHRPRRLAGDVGHLVGVQQQPAELRVVAARRSGDLLEAEPEAVVAEEEIEHAAERPRLDVGTDLVYPVPQACDVTVD